MKLETLTASRFLLAFRAGPAVGLALSAAATFASAGGAAAAAVAAAAAAAALFAAAAAIIFRASKELNISASVGESEGAACGCLLKRKKK